ncbi:MAG TPA: sugar phosphate isomerase/epimerase [Firmicutes bacterium]|nr:sugar phosphate isomerase/epimerase [Bacillota bacterium]
MKIAASSYSFSQYLNNGRMTQLDCVAKAKDMGFDAIEFVELRPPEGTSPLDYAKALREECERHSMPVSNFTVGAELLHPSTTLEDEIERVKAMVDLAAVLGAPSMRHDATAGYAPGARSYHGFRDALAVVAPACRAITEYAAEKGIRTMVENHGFFCQDSERVEALVNTVAHENFGLLADMGNFLCADEDPAAAFGRVAPYAFYVHAKDFHVKNGGGCNPGEGFSRSRGGHYLRGAIIGHGDVPLRSCLAALRDSGYRGNIAVEFEGMEDCLTGLRIGLANLRRAIADTER